MNRFWAFIERMNLALWIAVIFLFHLILYLSLGTDRWLYATVLATATYTAAFALLKALARNNKKRGVR
ncbi:hypothetical protein CIG75_01405 [Tumebacillus algifaecis]|uniref:Uncharacterized protein n=1 Tax=Tumebacillus algifaecis TaxID=1214604 RepID=A0A223CWR1_9BACL|nr:hypothetical protein [Tumebacillus algifaecis]ASS73760.1 hypothetical protein CIG75_01405 [Tumebacillus algifaecis]